MGSQLLTMRKCQDWGTAADLSGVDSRGERGGIHTVVDMYAGVCVTDRPMKYHRKGM